MLEKPGLKNSVLTDGGVIVSRPRDETKIAHRQASRLDDLILR